MCRFLLLHKTQAIPVLRITIEVLNWTDAEAVNKTVPFCGALVLLSIATNNTELRQFVTKDLFSAIIQGLSFESNAFICAELVGLCREIYVYLSDRDPTPRQVLYSRNHYIFSFVFGAMVDKLTADHTSFAPFF